MRSAFGPVLLMLGAFTALEISEGGTGRGLSEESSSENACAEEGSPGTPSLSTTAAVERIPTPGIGNFYRLGPDLYSGGRPSGEAGYKALAALGVKTVICVDGAPPNVEASRREGMRTVHLPIGYEGIDLGESARLIKAVRTFSGPIFIHCRLGKHRGPTAAAVVAMTNDGWNAKQGLDWLKTAGTAREYSGLFRTVKSFRPPDAAALAVVPDDWPEVADIPQLRASMIELESSCSKLLENKQTPSAEVVDRLAATYRTLVPHSQAQGSGAVGGSKATATLGEDAREQLVRALENAERLQNLLKSRPSSINDENRSSVEAAIETAVDRVDRDCKECHQAHRN